MKVHTIQRRINRIAYRLLAVGGVVLMAVACSQASAQSPLMNYLSNPESDQAGHGAAGARQVSHDGQDFRIIDSSSVKTAADLRGPIGSAVHGGTVKQTSYNSCNSGSCNGGACYGGSCGQYGSYGNAWACGPPCEPYCYGMIEALYVRRLGDRGATFSGQNLRLRQFDYETAPRLTIGSLCDCVIGFEASFTGVFDWDRARRATDPDGNLSAIFEAGGVDIMDDDLSGFNNAIVQEQLWEAEYWSVEGNAIMVGWDFAKLLVGGRYLEYDERFRFRSLSMDVDPTTGRQIAGDVFSEIKNRLVGMQVGLDLKYPLGQFAYWDFRGRAGLYANIAEALVRLGNNERNVIANFDEIVELAGVFEMGSGFRYQLGEMLTIRGGTEFWYIGGIGTAPGQIPTLVTPFWGQNVRANDDVVFFGVSLGAELRY